MDGVARVRLHKWIAASGAMSRRKAEEAMAAGRVRVNGELAREPGTSIDPMTDYVEIDGRPVRQPDRRRVMAFHKPRRVMTTKHDPEGRRTILDFFPAELRRLNPVGRLDYDSEGLLLLTDDGELANRLAHPRYGVEKEYRVWVSGRPAAAIAVRLVDGLTLSDGPGRFESAREAAPGVFDCVVSEGRNRFVRRMWDAVGHPVERLLRTRIGELRLGSLPPGEFRELGPDDLARLLGSPAAD